MPFRTPEEQCAAKAAMMPSGLAVFNLNRALTFS